MAALRSSPGNNSPDLALRLAGVQSQSTCPDPCVLPGAYWRLFLTGHAGDSPLRALKGLLKMVSLSSSYFSVALHLWDSETEVVELWKAVAWAVGIER